MEPVARLCVLSMTEWEFPGAAEKGGRLARAGRLLLSAACRHEHR